MKLLKSFTTLCLVLAFCFQAQGQFGIKAGLNGSTTWGTAEEFNGDAIESVGIGMGFQGGVFYQFLLGESLGTMIELNYEARNGVKNIEYTITNPTNQLQSAYDLEATNSFGLLNIPILFLLGGEKFKFYAGPNVGFLLSANQTVNGKVDFTPDLIPDITFEEEETDLLEEPNDGNDNTSGPLVNGLEVGVNIGAMYHLSEKLFLDLRLNQGITDVTNNDYDYSLITNESRSDSDRQFSAQLSLGYRF